MMKLSALLDSIDVLNIEGPIDIYINQIKTDSRKVNPGDIFVAVKGTKLDGHNFIEDAIAKGASCVIYDSLKFQNRIPNRNVCFVRVANSSIALTKLASAFYGFPSRNLKLIGITGTNGKTSTAVLIEHILKKEGMITGRIGTIGYCWGDVNIDAPLTTPDPLLLNKILRDMAHDGVETVVMEVSSHALDQSRIFDCIFDIAVFTNLTQDHLDYHNTMDAYFKAKTLLFSDYLNKQGTAVINVDDPYGVKLVELLSASNFPEQNIITYGIKNKEAKVTAENIQCSPEVTMFKIRIQPLDVMIEIRSFLLGILNVYNILASVGATFGLVRGVDVIKEGIESVECIRGRLERIATNLNFHVIIDYAHTPDALEKTLQSVREWTRGRLIVVFGCGGDRDRTKRPLMAKSVTDSGDVVIITSDNPRSEDPQSIINDILCGVPKTWAWVSPESLLSTNGKQRIYTTIVDRKKAIEKALMIAQANDVIVIAGKGHETYQIIGGEKIPFDDKLVVMDFFGKAVKQ